MTKPPIEFPDHEMLSILGQGERDVHTLQSRFPHLKLATIVYYCDLYTLQDEISTIRDLPVLHDLHPDLEPEIIEETLLDQLIIRGVRDVSELERRCPSYSRNTLEHKVMQAKVNDANQRMRGHTDNIRKSLYPPTLGHGVDHRPQAGSVFLGFGRKKTRPHRP